jgi:isopentenyl phosphate kinase
MDLVFVKLGGSLITDKTRPYTLREGVLERLAAELAECVATTPPPDREAGEGARGVRLLVGHGAGSFPHHSATKHQTHKGLLGPQSVRGLCEVSRDVFRLNRLVIEALLGAGMPAMPFQPSAARISEGGRIREWHNPRDRARAVDRRRPRRLRRHLHGHRDGRLHLLDRGRLRLPGGAAAAAACDHGARVDGVLDQENRVIPEVTRANFEEVSRLFAKTEGEDVTGGMRHKVERMLALAAAGCETKIVTGLTPGSVRDAVLGRPVVGTSVRQ